MNYQFLTSREWDKEAEIYFYRARFYSPEIGRFLTEDPIGFWGGDVNFYSYVFNNPVNFVDPWGLAKPTIPGYWKYLKWLAPRIACTSLKNKVQKAEEDNNACKELGIDPIWDIDPDAYKFLEWCYKWKYLKK